MYLKISLKFFTFFFNPLKEKTVRGMLEVAGVAPVRHSCCMNHTVHCLINCLIKKSDQATLSFLFFTDDL